MTTSSQRRSALEMQLLEIMNKPDNKVDVASALSQDTAVTGAIPLERRA